ncbi:hypothetical protein M413DRAFT_24588 [Hebeloma cylindrosporum]|uniref:CUE domain-containing protein n=1 Tax=Hebeloma cylindrosporum TaxID=76867 RepID=A0A0C3CML9_HEBCY|nr:hypothetical protein M413DRAFT_24588 [Hebeloma cylindrosporum h7]
MADTTTTTSSSPPPTATAPVIDAPVPASSSPPPSESPSQSIVPPTTASPITTPSPPISTVLAVPAATSESLLESPARPPAELQTREAVVDPRVVALRGMFPDYDDLILQSVLESAGGNQDLAIDTLLGMSDPDYRSERSQPIRTEQTPVLSQEELDEQFARQLVLQEQQQQQQQWMAANGGQRPPAVYHSTRPGASPQGWTPPPSQGQERPSEFQEQFNKIAETGKKTFGTLFSKVKAKIQEFDQGRTSSTGQGSSGGTYQAQQPQWSPPTGPPGTGVAGGTYFAPQPTHPQQQPAYYDPNSQVSASASATGSPARTPSAGAGGIQGYDVSSPAPPPTTHQQLQRQPSPQPVVPSAAPIDGGKLGLLPKRPVSLLRDPNAPAPAKPVDDDDDGLEYAENPFDAEPVAGKK